MKRTRWSRTGVAGIVGLVGLAAGCGSSSSKGGVGTAVAPVTTAATGAGPTGAGPTGVGPTGGPAPGGGSTGLPTNATLTDLGAPAGGLPVISDLTVFDGELWLFESINPLQTFGAQVWTYDGAGAFTKVLDDPTSQGYLRGKALGGKLYVPDSDPNGLAPGIVWIFDSASAPPRRTEVDAAVHNFDVLELRGRLFVSGGLDTGASSVSRFDPTSGRWTAFSTGAFSRLKYMGVLDGQLYASKRNTGATTADFVQIDAAGQQAGLSLIQGQEALTVCVEEVAGALYMTLSSAQGVSHVRLEPGGAVTPLTGTSGALLFDFVQHTDGNVYAVGSDFASRSFVYGSTDGVDFVRLVDVPDLRFGQVPGNADGRASIASFGGELYCGSSTNGKLYRVD